MNESARESLRAGLQLGLAALIATALLAGTYFLTRDRIDEAAKRSRMQALEVVLPAARADGSNAAHGSEDTPGAVSPTK